MMKKGILGKGCKRHMCTKIKEINGMKPNEIIERFSNPLNKKENSMGQILKQMNIKCAPIDFSTLDERINLKSKNCILCLSYCENQNISIFYSYNISDEDIDVVLAHELAYCCLHLPPQTKFHIKTEFKNDIIFLDSYYKTSSYVRSFFNSFRNEKRDRETHQFAQNLLEKIHSQYIEQEKKSMDYTLENEKNLLGYERDTIKIIFKNNLIGDFLIANGEIQEDILISTYSKFSTENSIKFIKKKTKKNIPTFFKVFKIVPISLFTMGVVMLFLDFYLNFFNLSSSAYIIWCLSWLSLYITNRLAIKEWKNTNEKEKRN